MAMYSRITLRHPGYNALNILFSFPAEDGPEHNRAHYATILSAGSIFTGVHGDDNIWLSTDPVQALETRLQPDPKGLIAAGEYYLHVTSASATAAAAVPSTPPYPVFPNFRSWQFPRGELGQLWQQARYDTEREVASSPANEACRVTGQHLAVEPVHIIPSSEKAWFARNEMARFGEDYAFGGVTVADSASNMMGLGRDAHWLWDKLHFAIVPRQTDGDIDDNDEGTGLLAWHTEMLVSGQELREQWHHKRLLPLAGRAPEYLYARFAWNIFPKLQGFLLRGQPRYPVSA